MNAGEERLKNEIQKLREQASLSHEALRKFKEEKLQLERQVKQKVDETAKLTSEMSMLKAASEAPDESELNKNLVEKEKMIQKLSEVVKVHEDNSKALAIEGEAAGAKARFATAQAEVAEKKAAKQGKAAGKPDAAAAHKMKQLEVLVSKMKETEKKAASELQKRKENEQKLKKENRALQNKIQELERKVKKAA